MGRNLEVAPDLFAKQNVRKVSKASEENTAGRVVEWTAGDRVTGHGAILERSDPKAGRSRWDSAEHTLGVGVCGVEGGNCTH